MVGPVALRLRRAEPQAECGGCGGAAASVCGARARYGASSDVLPHRAVSLAAAAWPCQRLPSIGQATKMPAIAKAASMPQTLFDKIWDAHLVARRADGRDLIYIDRHVLHELHAPHAFEKLEKQQRPVRRPDLTFSMQDHTVATKPGPRRQHQSVRRGLPARDARGQPPGTASASSISAIPSRASRTSSRRSSAWCCRARPMRCRTATPARSAASARSRSAAARPSWRTSSRRR